MLFNSYEFIFLFLPITFIGFFTFARYVGKQAAISWIVAASFFFYGWWDVRYLPLLFGSICFNYIIGSCIGRYYLRRKIFLFGGILGNLLLLGYFKYAGFFVQTINDVTSTYLFSVPVIVLPLGISFFTFTQTAYLVDVYRRETAPYSFLTYCQFVTIFPHLIAGPIISQRDMLPQFLAEKTFTINYHNLALGITMFSIGLFKKIFVADNLAIWVEAVFANAEHATFIEAWIGALSYTFQLYFDFSGYSEMAIGLGLMFNLQFPVNFNSPYQSHSIIDFWRRWHMTLGIWVRDYLYIPLGGSHFGETRKMLNLFISMLLIGLWHGAGWTFVLWGGIHGVLLMINHQWRRLHISLPSSVNWCMTFIPVIFCWVLFRAENMDVAFALIKSMVRVDHIVLPSNSILFSHLHFLQGVVSFAPLTYPFSVDKHLLILFGLTILILKMPNPQALLKHFKPNLFWLIAVLFMFMYSVLHLTSYSEFLYFQF